jgi:tripartite-type tricarboxylate transporter receptor subunit TctC
MPKRRASGDGNPIKRPSPLEDSVTAQTTYSLLRTPTLILAWWSAIFVGSTHAQSQSFPTNTITFVAPTAPGSNADLLPRLIAPVLNRALGVPVIVENKAGAASAIGAGAVARALPDGHTLLLAPPPVLSVNQWLYKKLSYNPDKDFTPVIGIATTPNVIVVHPSVPARQLAELIALAKAKPGEINFASGGSGTTHHLCGELLKARAGIQLTHVSYKSPAPALQDVIAGQVQMICENLSSALPFIKSGQLRAIALTAAQRDRRLPDVPTAAEAGLPGLEVSVWFGVVAPAATPRPIIDRLNTEIAKALRDPAVSERLESMGLTNIADTPEQFGRLIAVDSAKWRKVIESANLQVD